MPEERGLEWYWGRANYLQDLYKDRDDMYDEIDDARFGNWELPADLASIPWVLKSTEPAFAITADAATGLIANNNPIINITPSNKDNMAITDIHERGLGWILDAASRRRKATVVEEMAGSAINYAEVCTLVTFLPSQIEKIKGKKGDPKRLEAMLRHSDFLIRTYHPRTVYPRYSEIGVEEVVLITDENPHAIVDLWGEAANELKERMLDENFPKMVKLYEYLSMDYHVVWVETGEGDERIELHNAKWNWPFLPWACNITGGELLKDTDKDRKSIHSVMYHFDFFDLMNRTRTLRFSDMVRNAGTPRRTFQSEDPEATAPKIVNASGEPYEVIAATEKVTQQPPHIPDPSLQALYSELKNDLQKSTLSDLLLGGEIPSEAAFSSINLVTHSAMQAIEDARSLLSRHLANVCEIILLWIHYEQAEVFGTVRDPIDRSKVHDYLIDWEDIDPNKLYIEVRVDANLPLDQDQRILAGRAAIDAGLASHQVVMEDLGYTNGREIYEQIIEERVMDNELQIRMANRQFEASTQAQQEMRQSIMAEIMQSPEMQQIMQMAQANAGGADPNAAPQNGPAPTAPPAEERISPEIEQENLTPPEAGESAAPGAVVPGEGADRAGGAEAQARR